MSSTSQQIDDAKKMAARVEAGEQVSPISAGGASSEQLSKVAPQKPAGLEIPKGPTTGGLNRENFEVVDAKEAMAVVGKREIAPVVGAGQEHNLAKQFWDPALRAEEQTAVPDAQISTAEKQTQVPQLQQQAAERFRHCEERSDEAIHLSWRGGGLLRCARNDV